MLKSSDPVYQRDGTVTTLGDMAGGGSSITVDSSLSGTSTNPVQNKVIKSALDLKSDIITIDSALSDSSINPVQNKVINDALDLKQNISDVIINVGAGGHNSIYRGIQLGTEVTADQWESIQNGTFDNLYLGDYWKIGDIKYRIAAFDYWLNTGNTECTDHHVVLVPDTVLYDAKMNDTNITTGGYVGSKMYTDNLATAKTTINTAFGSSHILSHRELLTDTVTDGKATNYSWLDSTVELMSEVMVYSINVYGSAPGYETGIDKTQLPLFMVRPDLICNRDSWLLRSVASSSNFAVVNNAGLAATAGASYELGVRPVFAIYQPITTNETKKSATKKRSVKK